MLILSSFVFAGTMETKNIIPLTNTANIETGSEEIETAVGKTVIRTGAIEMTIVTDSVIGNDKIENSLVL